MPTRSSLESFALTLPSNDGPQLTEQSSDASFRATVPSPEGYVWPDLVLEDDSQASILLLTAPGAMGKSAAARAIANTLRAPLVDLAKLPIGSDSLTGLLTRVLGWQQAPAFVTQLQRGEASLVLDSLDEAQLAAGRQHFAAFMKNVVELLRGGSKSRQVIICGRRDAIETAFLTLADLGEDVSQGSIASLTYPQSCNLINSVLDETHRDGKKYVIHRTHSGPFGKHRDRVLVDMARALGSSAEAVEDSWEVAGDFLGYPPVLLVLARHLVVDNPSAVSAPGYSHPNSSDRGGLLREVIEELLDRETEKVRGQIAAPLGLSSSDPKLRIVYTRDEQVLRLIRFLTHQEITIPLPSALSPDERVTYEEQIEGFVPDHPFLRGAEVENVVFSDYMDALVLTSPTIAVQGLKNNGSSLDAGPFFAHFVHAMAPRSEGMALPDLQEKYLDRVVKSFAAGSLVQGTFVYSDSEDRPGTLVLSEGAEDSDRARHASHLAFRIPDRSGVLELSSPVTRGVLVTSGAATVSSTTDEIVLGPDLTIVAQELHFDSQRINVSSAEHVRFHKTGECGYSQLNH